MSAKKILIVDDDLIQQRLIKIICQTAGYQVSGASNGEEGICAAFSQKPDLILMDVMMPRMDGYAAITELKKNRETMNVPVIMLTAVGYKSNRELGLKLGVVDYVTKPFNITQLALKIKQILADGVCGG